MAAKGKSSKKVKEKESAKARVETETKYKKEKAEAVTVAEVAEVTEPLEVVETEKVERVAAAVEEVRPEEIEQELRELKPKDGKKILVGLPRLTRFERARIIGARALQLSLGAPPLVAVAEGVTNAIMMAAYELEQKALPISLRRVLPNGQYQDIPMKWLLEN
ncbi:MAG: DNA-directed RNA polymerase subunit K [Nitrososphaerales archaeon]